MIEDKKEPSTAPKVTIKRIRPGPTIEGTQGTQSVSRIGETSINSTDERTYQNIAQDSELFLLSRVIFLQPDQNFLPGEEFKEDDLKFFKFLENAANGQITVQDLTAFGLEQRSRNDPCKSVISYILNLRQKATVLLQQLKLSQLTSHSQNDLVQEAAKLRSKLKTLENVKKDELTKKLEAKEQECLEYRARLTQIDPGAALKIKEFEPIEVLEGEVMRKIDDIRDQMRLSHERINQLFEEISLMKTTVRDKIVIPPQIEHSEAAINDTEEEKIIEEEEEQVPEIVNTQVNQNLQILTEQNTNEPTQDNMELNIRPQTQMTEERKSEPRQIDLNSLPTEPLRIHHQHQNEIVYLERLDQEMILGLQDLQNQISAELLNLRDIEDSLLEEKGNLHLETVRIQSKESQMIAKIKFLENKLAQTMTQKEEQNIKLKSEIVIYKNKIQAYKQKMKDAVATFETKKIQEMRQQLADEVALKELEIEQLKKHLEAKNEGMSALENQIQDLSIQLSGNEFEYQTKLHEQNVIISDLSERLKGIDDTYSQQLTHIDQIRETTQKRLNLEEQERTMNSLKLDYLLNNNRKLYLQKKFLEKTLEKDLKNLHTEMRKAEIDMQKDAFLTSQVAQKKLHEMYLVMKGSLSYAKEVVQFMNFELGDQIHGTGDIQTSSIQLPDKNIDRNDQKNTDDQQDSQPEQEETPSKRNSESKPLDFYFQKNIYEIAEVVLSVLCEIYQDAHTQTTLDVVHLFTLIQSKTNKSIVQDIYNKYFAQNRIHFLQHLQRTLNRNSTLEREKAEMRRKLDELKKVQSLSTKPAVLGNQNQIDDYQESNPNQTKQITEINQEATTHRTLSPQKVMNALQRFSERKVIETQQEELRALKFRMKEVRLNLQRQISDLQEQLQLSKQHHQAELTKLRLEYGRDLSALHKSHLVKEDEIREQIEYQFQERLQMIDHEHQEQIKQLNQEYENEYENLRKESERSELALKELDREIKKIKKKSNNTAQGGWGTFSIVFEENPKKHHPLILNNSSQNQNTSSGGSKKSEMLTNIFDAAKFADDSGKEKNNGEQISLERLAHFIEVGFLFDQKNFRHLDTYSEKQMDSTIIKHLFEFQQDIDKLQQRGGLDQQERLKNDSKINFRAITIQNKIKQQLYENYALFNEINPLYVSLNLGRNVSPFWDESISQENFKLIKRDGFYLAETYLTVNFLRCEEPELVIRIVAFDNDTHSSYSFDLLYEDLLLFVEGNSKLLDIDNINDLCQMILNNMTRIRNKGSLNGGQSMNSNFDGGNSEDGQENLERISTLYSQKLNKLNSKNQIKMAESSLAVEHKIFFNEAYRNEYERNKLIMVKNDKRKKGLLSDKKIDTDFEKSIVYESYEKIYNEVIQVNETSNVRAHFILKKGKMSENFILTIVLESVTIIQPISVNESQMSNEVSIGTNDDQKVNIIFTQDLCLYQSNITKQQMSQQIASIIIKVPDSLLELVQRALAYVISIEKIFGSENFVIRIAEIRRYDELTMSNFKWDPTENHNFGSLTHQEQTIFLIKKNNDQYLRLTHYEVLNTEIRSLMFKHSYGYDLSLLDFGKLQALQSSTLKLRQPIKPQKLGSTPITPIVTSGMNFIFRDFGIIRLKTLTNITTAQKLNTDMSQLSIKDAEQPLKNNFMVDSEEDEENYTIENHYTMYAFYDDFQCLNRGEVYIQLKIDGIFINLVEKLSNVADLLKLKPDEFRQKINQEKEHTCNLIFDQLIIIKDISQTENGDIQTNFKVIIDPKQQPMSEVIEMLKRQKFKQQLDENDIVATEFQDVKVLDVTLKLLAECQKMTQVSVINRRVYKVTCYFMNNLKNITLQPLPERLFDWQIIYIEAELRTSTKSITLALTEKDIIIMVNQLLDRQHGGEKLLQDSSEILNSRVKRDRLIEFVLDSIVIDEQTNTLKVSISHLQSRIQDRFLLHHYFMITGGRYLTLNNGNGFFDDQEMSVFKTSLPQIEMSRNLIVNLEKDFSDKKYDLRIFEVKIKHARDQIKYQFEIFALDQPQAVFRCDFLCQKQQQGKKLMIERFNVIQQLHQDYEENKFMKDGMVYSVIEQGFPHSLTFMLLEPVSHIQWQFQIQDDKLNPIENRQEKEFFVKTTKNLIENGLWFNQIQSKDGLPPCPQNIVRDLAKLGYQKSIDTYENPDAIEIWQGNLKQMFNEGGIIYQREIQVQEGISTDISISIEEKFKTIKIGVGKQYESRFVIESQRESSRILAGFLPINSKAKVFCCIETSCGYTEQERAFRIIIKEPKQNKKLVDLILSEKHITDIKSYDFNKETFKVYSIKDEVKYSFNTGFRDSFALFQKMPEIITDFKSAFIQNEPPLRFTVPVDHSIVLNRRVYSLQHNENLIFIIYVKSDQLKGALNNFTVILFEQQSGYEETFFFDTPKIFTKEELNTLQLGVKNQNDKLVKETFSKIMDRRFKIKLMGEDMQFVANSKGGIERYIAYFIEANSMLTIEAPLNLNKRDQKFDIRNGIRYSLTQPDVILPAEKDRLPQERLITTLEKDDLMYDVSEVLDSFQLIMRIKTYDKENMSVISVSDINEKQIREELNRDSLTYLVEEPHRREELAKYFVQNTFYEETTKKMQFLQSSIPSTFT